MRTKPFILMLFRFAAILPLQAAEYNSEFSYPPHTQQDVKVLHVHRQRRVNHHDLRPRDCDSGQEERLRATVKALESQKKHLEDQIDGLQEKWEALERRIKSRQDLEVRLIAKHKLAKLYREEEQGRFQVEINQIKNELNHLRSDIDKNAESGLPILLGFPYSVEGISVRDPAFAQINAIFASQVESLEAQFEKSKAASMMGPEKGVRHRFIFRATKVESNKKSKRRIHGSVIVDLSYLGVVDSIHSETIIFRFCEDADFSIEKNQILIDMINQMLHKEIPRLKKKIFAKAHAVENAHLHNQLDLGHYLQSAMLEEEPPPYAP